VKLTVTQLVNIFPISHGTPSFIISPLDPMLRHMYPEEGMNVYCTQSEDGYFKNFTLPRSCTIFIYSFIYLATLSVAQTISLRMIRWLESNELERMWKERVAVITEVPSQYFLGE
jgi:hypothetical protein